MTSYEEIARHRVEADRQQLKKDMKCFMDNVADLRGKMTDENYEYIAQMLVSELTGSLVSDVVKSLERLKEAEYFADLASVDEHWND